MSSEEVATLSVEYYTQILSHIINSLGEKSTIDGFIRCWIDDNNNNHNDLYSFLHLLTRYNTMDLIKQAGGEPANFLDVGGTADSERVEKAFRMILKDPNVEAILINIFGGIVRCDRVAQGVVDAYKNIGEIPVPIIVRLQGTNAEEAKTIIDNSGLNVHSAVLLKEAAQKVSEVLA